MELVYRFENRRQAGDAVIPLLDSKQVIDVGVVVRQDSILIGVKVERDTVAWVRGVLAGGTDVTKIYPNLTAWLPTEDMVEVYHTKKGVRRFKGYSYRRTRPKRKL